MFGYDNIPRKPVRWETIWVSKGNSFTGRYTGRKHKPGDIWQDEDGCYWGGPGFFGHGIGLNTVMTCTRRTEHAG